MLYQVHLTWVGFKLTLVVIGTDCIGTKNVVVNPTTKCLKPMNEEIPWLYVLLTDLDNFSETAMSKFGFPVVFLVQA
jgi:hypothetical protein